MAAAYLESVDQVIRKNQSKRGLAIIFANDYSHLPNLKMLEGPDRDAARMKDAFNQLQIATLTKRNVTNVDLMILLTEVARLRSCPSSYRSISVVFSGHGREKGELYMQDGSTIHVQAMVDTLLPRQAPYIGNIPKLFFIDACRGALDMNTVVVSRTGASNSIPQVGHQRNYENRGANDVTIVIPDEGNSLIAYSTSNTYQAFETRDDGGIWMKTLAQKLVSSTESITAVLGEVTEDLVNIYQTPGWPRNQMQLPHIESKLLTRVYLNPKSPPHVPAPICPMAPPVGLTERGLYKVKFQNLEQKKIVRDVKYEEHQSVDKKFFYVVTFVECSNNRRHRVQGETLPTKSDAKESAAQHAVNDLGGGATRSSPKPVPTISRGKDPVMLLKEFCEQKKLQEPKYKDVVCAGNLYQMHVIVRGNKYVGKAQNTIKDAKKSAAQKALNGLK